MTQYRKEVDLLGERDVPADAYWGIHTLRAVENFNISNVTISDVPEFVRGMVMVKKATALANGELGAIPSDIAKAIVAACDEILTTGKCLDQFPSDVYQGGAGTSVNMNTNEVVANLALEKIGHKKGEYDVINPMDHVNASQSTNDAYPTGFRIAVYNSILKLIDKIQYLHDGFDNKAKEFAKILKMGRTQLQDAVPMTVGQEFKAFAVLLEEEVRNLKRTAELLLEVNLGATAIGTGLNTPKGYDVKVADYIAQFTGLPFVTAENKFEALAAHDAIVETHGAIRQLAMSLFKIANDIRLLASGPRSGIGEILIPENEPGSSIMPGKVNPTQCEALTMVCAQVFGNDTTIAFVGSQGHFQLNVFNPVMVANFLQSAQLLGDACVSFDEHCATGIQPNYPRIKQQLENSLMLVTALNTHIGYENAAKIAKTAHKNGTTLREEAINLGLVSAEDFDKWVRPEDMVGSLK